jgi:hypothetical protein
VVNEVQTLSGAKGGMLSPSPHENSSQEIGHYCKHHSLFVLGDGDAKNKWLVFLHDCYFAVVSLPDLITFLLHSFWPYFL